MAKGYPKPKKFKPTNPEKYYGDVDSIICRSSWEVKLARWCDFNESVKFWNMEEIVIKYYSNADMKERSYYVDFIIKMESSDGTTKVLLIEVKPYSQTIKPKKGRKSAETYFNECYTYQVNCDKWAAARAFAASNNMEFLILSEYELGIKEIPANGIKK